MTTSRINIIDEPPYLELREDVVHVITGLEQNVRVNETALEALKSKRVEMSPEPNEEDGTAPSAESLRERFITRCNAAMARPSQKELFDHLDKETPHVGPPDLLSLVAEYLEGPLDELDRQMGSLQREISAANVTINAMVAATNSLQEELTHDARTTLSACMACFSRICCPCSNDHPPWPAGIDDATVQAKCNRVYGQFPLLRAIREHRERAEIRPDAPLLRSGGVELPRYSDQ